jgi:hypothetical protein
MDKGESACEESLREKVAHCIMHWHISSLEEDLQARHMLGAPLGAAVWSHERVRSRIGGVPRAADIPFRLSLPSLAHIPIKELIAIRAAEGASFAIFRSALTKAAREMVTDGKGDNPEEAAAEIIDTIRRPIYTRVKSEPARAEAGVGCTVPSLSCRACISS